jgi:DNA-binding Lrp family transcriptional regulator
LKDEQRKILKLINEATNRMDLNMFAEAVELTPSVTIANVQTLTKEGFLRKLDSGYGLTEKGKNTLKATAAVPQEKAFQFYRDVDKPLESSAGSLEEFYRQIKQVGLDSLDFHLYRDDFENWLRQVIGNEELADEAIKFKETRLCGEELRNALLKSIDASYSIENAQ